jgi:hypothetical protein
VVGQSVSIRERSRRTGRRGWWAGPLSVWFLVAASALPAAAQQATWLDGALEQWNAPGMAVPRSPVPAGFGPAQCQARLRRASGAEEETVVAAGWQVAEYWPTQGRGDVTLVMATSDHDGMCRPTGFNAFVFSGGRFAGTISPLPMGARSDGTLVRPPTILPDGRLDASFIRYSPSDPLCCPSRPQTRVLYRVEVTDAGPALIAERPGGATLRLPGTGTGPAALAEASLEGTGGSASLEEAAAEAGRSTGAPDVCFTLTACSTD